MGAAVAAAAATHCVLFYSLNISIGEEESSNPLVNAVHACIMEPEEGFGRNWQIHDGKDQLVRLAPLWEYIREMEPEFIDHADISWKGELKPHLQKGERYDRADIRFPGIVVLGAPNPSKKKYRLIDGAHRMAKMKLETSLQKSQYYVIPLKLFLSMVEDVPVVSNEYVSPHVSHYLSIDELLKSIKPFFHNDSSDFVDIDGERRGVYILVIPNRGANYDVSGAYHAAAESWPLVHSPARFFSVSLQDGEDKKLEMLLGTSMATNPTIAALVSFGVARLFNPKPAERACTACHMDGKAYCYDVNDGKGTCVENKHGACDQGREGHFAPINLQSVATFKEGCPSATRTRDILQFFIKERFPHMVDILLHKHIYKSIEERDRNFKVVIYCFWPRSEERLTKTALAASRVLNDAAFTFFDTRTAKKHLLEHMNVEKDIEMQFRTGAGNPALTIFGNVGAIVDEGMILRAWEKVQVQTRKVVRISTSQAHLLLLDANEYTL